MRLIVSLLGYIFKRPLEIEVALGNLREEGWEQLHRFSPRRLAGYTTRRWVWEPTGSPCDYYDGYWVYATDEQVARAYLEEQFKPKASSALLFD